MAYARMLEFNPPSFSISFVSSDLTDTDTEDTATSPPELFPTRVRQQVLQPVHAQVQLNPADACTLFLTGC